MSVTHSTGNGLKPTNIKASDSFFSKDHENVIVSKLAAKLDCGSVMERYSKEFKSIDPVDVTTTGLSALESQQPKVSVNTTNSNMNNPMTPLTISLKFTGDRKALERKK